MNFQIQLNEYGKIIDNALEKFLPGSDCLQKNVIDAMRYSVMAGGKRIRPVLTLEFCHACGGNIESALPFACAIEFIHTYSLIHDDLPCMDNDDLRRGRPSCHIKFGEATALLAGDALLSLAFETALCNNNIGQLCNAQKAVSEMARASGVMGMVGGQQVDLESEGKDIDLKTLEYMHCNKTGAMIIAAAKIGCFAAGADKVKIEAAAEYASRIGLAFQIVDDILDYESDTETLGKPVQSDAEREKTTYITLLGPEKSRKEAVRLTEEAVQKLLPFGSYGGFLKELAYLLLSRDH